MSQNSALTGFSRRHIGINSGELEEMLSVIGVNSLEELINQTIPDAIRREGSLNLPEAQSEYDYMEDLKKVAAKNKLYKNYIGQGYYGTITPSVILRNVFTNQVGIPNILLTRLR
ncbi:MAG: hypothetical protein R2879_04975 [Saprospiraceae bacterium]